MRIVFDIDGTLADCTHRLHHIQKDQKDWDAFFSGCREDSPILETITVCQALYTDHHDIEFWTGRPRRTRVATREWLAVHVGWWAKNRPLKMRGDEDRRPDTLLKVGYIGYLPPDLVFEDRQGVVDAYRERGLTVYQVATGDF